MKILSNGCWSIKGWSQICEKKSCQKCVNSYFQSWPIFIKFNCGTGFSWWFFKHETYNLDDMAMCIVHFMLIYNIYWQWYLILMRAWRHWVIIDFAWISCFVCVSILWHHLASTEVMFAFLQDVIDGDLCEQYPTLTAELQRKIADDLDRTPGEILKKLEDIRNRII